MIPPDIQNEAITLYLKTDPELQSMVENSTTLLTRRPLIDSGAFNQNRLYVVEDDEDIYMPTGVSNTTVMLCILVLGLLMVFSAKKLKLV
jgi:hypothetical protein